ncbi:MAG: transketolase [Acidimicrobiales bacterium]
MSAGAELEQRGINVIRGLAMDAPQKANSGHPGTAMALAPLAHVLFTRVMQHDPSEPSWPDRDRFVLSAGHASILLYSMLYLTGYGLTLEDLKAFRQWGSLTPGHPEHGHTKGVEVTTGPLGQGFADAVGMGIAERYLRARFSSEVCDHHTFVICSDGDLEEGISHEAASLAGHLGLGRLVYVYDDNHITIDGPTEIALSDDPVKRFQAYGWHVDNVGEIANDPDALESALRRAMAVEDAPSMIVLRSHIGWPSPNRTDTKEAHGEPLGAEEVAATKELLGLPPEQQFYVPDDVLDMYREAMSRGEQQRKRWAARLASWKGDKMDWEACLAGRGLAGFEEKLPSFTEGDKVPTRKAIGACLNSVYDMVPGLIAGGADLTGNTGTRLDAATQQSASDHAGRQMGYGIREHAMGAVMNGMALHGGVVPVGGTFFIFSDYMRPAVRIAALSQAHVIYSWTHDSVGLGEDGPTHQPIEHLAAMRAMPGLRLIRPADANECASAVRLAIEADGPTALVLSRQNTPVLSGTAGRYEDLKKGAYVLAETPGHAATSAGAQAGSGGAGDPGRPDIVLVGTGTEVALCLDAARELLAKGVAARVVSMPSFDLFEAQPPAYRAEVLPEGIPVLAVEAATSFGWDRYADATVSIDRFGSSAPGPENMRQFGFTAANVATRAMALLSAGR